MTLADDFCVREEPVFLIDFAFDSGSVYIWTHPVSGTVDGKTYQPLGSLTGSLAIRNSIDSQTFDSSSQLAGINDELAVIGRTEQFQRRPASIALGNFDASGTITNVETQFIGTLQNFVEVLSLDDPTLTITMSSVFADLNRPHGTRYTDEDQTRIDPNDTFFKRRATAQINEPAFGS